MRSFKIYIKIAMWLLSLFLILWGAEKVYDFFLLQNKDIKASYVTNEKINADVLVVGACEAFSTVRPDFVEETTGLKTYNLGTNHSLPSEMYALLYLYLQNNKAPKTLILQLSEQALDTRFNTFNSFRFAQFNDEHIHKIIAEKDPQYYAAFAFPFGKYAMYNRMFTFNVKEGFIDWYYGSKSNFEDGYYKPFDLHVSLEYTKSKYGKSVYFKNDSLELQYVEKIVQLSQKHNITVKAFALPMWKGAEVVVKNKDEINAELDSILFVNGVCYQQFNNLEFTYDSTAYMTPFRVKSSVADEVVGELKIER